jgi:dolichol kinase
MDKGHIFRRLFHLCGPLILVYYLLPHRMFHISREAWLLAGLAILLSIEAVRLLRGKVFFGLREYEGRQISAYAWAGMGATIGFLLFPEVLVACAIFGLCWVDPLIGEMRRRRLMRHYPAVPLIVYFAIAAACLMALSDRGWIAVLAIAIVGSFSAVAIEKHRLPVDDDFTMLIVPLVVMTLADEYLAIAFQL